jgi:hypothetical protein
LGGMQQKSRKSVLAEKKRMRMTVESGSMCFVCRVLVLTVETLECVESYSVRYLGVCTGKVIVVAVAPRVNALFGFIPKRGGVNNADSSALCPHQSPRPNVPVFKRQRSEMLHHTWYLVGRQASTCSQRKEPSFVRRPAIRCETKNCSSFLRRSRSCSPHLPSCLTAQISKMFSLPVHSCRTTSTDSKRLRRPARLWTACFS